MAALTSNWDTNEKVGHLVGGNLRANTRLFKGALVATHDVTGYLTPAGDTPGVTFAGVAFEPGDNRVIPNVAGSGVDGAVGLRVIKNGSFVYDFAGARTQAVVGKKAYAVDDHTVALSATTTNDVYVGDIVGLVGEDRVRVRIDRAAG